MADSKKAEILKKLVEDLLGKMTFENFEIRVEEKTGPEGEALVINVSTPESNLLIGQYGATLNALQHLARVIARRKFEEKVKFLIDVNHYLSQKASSILEVARAARKQALEERRPVVLRPMGAYERRIVHLELAGAENIRTESVGEGEERRVVVRPVGELEKAEEKL